MNYRVSVAVAGRDTYRVTIEDHGTRTVHDILAPQEAVARYAQGTMAGRLVKAVVEFLLEHDEQEDLLPSFDLASIERRFPELPATISRRLETRTAQGGLALSSAER